MRAASSACLLTLSGCVMVFEPERVEYLDTPPPVLLGFPIADPGTITRTIGVDHDPVVQTSVVGDAICADYLGRAFPHCYDEHRGSDFILDGGFDAMDAGSVEVVAAADGVVISVADGNYDRCRAEGTEVTCDGFDMVANHVILEHQGRLVTKYWHLKSGSVAVEVGQQVACGDVLGLVGSSGFSSMPHLHFQVESDEGIFYDPYAGPYSQDVSLWEDQGPPEGLPEHGCVARR